jgi:hypothetical protein
MQKVVKNTSNKIPVVFSEDIADIVKQNENAVIVYKRSSFINEEFAMLSLISRPNESPVYGWITLIGKDYPVCLKGSSRKACINMANSIGKEVFVFNSLEEFMNNKDTIEIA